MTHFLSNASVYIVRSQLAAYHKGLMAYLCAYFFTSTNSTHVDLVTCNLKFPSTFFFLILDIQNIVHKSYKICIYGYLFKP
jgi:hypothetical protein